MRPASPASRVFRRSTTPLSLSALPNTGGSRLIQLDVLRGGAILLVLFRHSIVSSQEAGPLQRAVTHLWRFSATGIDLFFVLSGFLVGGLLFKELKTTGRVDVKRFLVRRCLRIWPAYYAFVLYIVFRLVRNSHLSIGQAMRAVWPNLLHVQNYFGSPRGITWSLALQEHFYLLLPAFLLLLTRRRGVALLARGIPVTAAILVVACTSLRLLINGLRPYDMWTHETPTHLRIDGLFWGVLLAYLYHFQGAGLGRFVTRHRSLLLSVGLMMIAPSFFFEEEQSPFAWTVGFTLLYFGYGCLVLVAIYWPRESAGAPSPGIASRMLAAIGVFSYSIYLWQYDLGRLPVHNHLLVYLPRHPAMLYWLVATAAYLGCAVAAGAIMARVIELPVIALRNRMFPARASAVALPQERVGN
jgi:peptidoglycan/LPS O-acetylase OafA/YrhL